MCPPERIFPMKLAFEFPCRSTRLARLGVRVLALALVLSQWTVTSLSPARADDASAPAEARAHYERGRAHYQAGRYKEAVVELERALSIDPHSPNLVYNVARVYELLGDMDRAIAYYERYQTMLPPHESEERERVESTLQRLRGARENGPVQPANAGQPQQQPRMKRGVADAAFWVTLGTSASAFAASGVTGALALEGNKTAQNFVLGKDGDVAERNHEVRRADRLALATDVLVLCGATFAVTSVLLYMLREKPVEDEAPAEAGFGFGANGQAVMLTFGGAL